MKTHVALACLWPALLLAQDPTPQGSPEALKKWHDEQIALGTANNAARPKRAEQAEKTVVELERNEKLMFQAYADVYAVSTSYGFDPDYIKGTGIDRRRRVETDQRSATRLDSIRVAGQPSAILTALVLRLADVERSEQESAALVPNWKDMLRRYERALDVAKGDDRPTNNQQRKNMVNLAIKHFERLVKLARGVVEFETKRLAEMKAESGALGRQIETGKTVTGREGN